MQHNAEHLLLQTHDYLYNYYNKTWSVSELPKGDNRLSYISKLSPESESFIATVADDQVIQSKDGKNWQHLAKLQTADDKETCEGRCTVYNYDLIKLPKGYNSK